MGLTFQNSAIAENSLLSCPILQQASNGVLDLSSEAVRSAGAVKVEIPLYVQQSWGDWVTVLFTSQSDPPVSIRRYCYLESPLGEFPSNCPYVAEVRLEPLWALPPTTYKVEYMVTSRIGNVASSLPTTIKVINTPEVPFGPVTIDTSFFGNYCNDFVGSWIVPGNYEMSPSEDIAIRSLATFASPGAASTDVQLNVYRTPNGESESQLIAYLQSPDGEKWTSVPVQSQVALNRGDLISIKLDGAKNARLFVALSM